MNVGGFLRALVRPEMQRTCSKCGYTWRVPRYYTKHHRTSGFTPSSGGPAGFERMSPASITSEQPDMLSEQNEQWVEAKARDSVYAKCGSERFRQSRIWSETSADHEGAD